MDGPRCYWLCWADGLLHLSALIHDWYDGWPQNYVAVLGEQDFDHKGCWMGTFGNWTHSYSALGHPKGSAGRACLHSWWGPWGVHVILWSYCYTRYGCCISRNCNGRDCVATNWLAFGRPVSVKARPPVLCNGVQKVTTSQTDSALDIALARQCSLFQDESRAIRFVICVIGVEAPHICFAIPFLRLV